MSIIERLDEFTSRQGIVSAEWCKLLDEVGKLQEQNKKMRESLEKISTDTVEVGFYVEPTWSAQIAREALAKVNNENN